MNSELKNEVGPDFQVTGFYVATIHNYEFIRDNNYVGMVILAVRDGRNWFSDGNKDPYT